MQQPNDQLLNSFTRALNKLHQTPHKELPVPIIFWLLMLMGVVAESERHFLSHWHDIWLTEVIALGKFDSWLRAKEALRSIAWIGFAHDRPGERAFGAAKETVIDP